MFERVGAGGVYRWRDRRLEDGPSSADIDLSARYCRKIGVGVLDINCTQLVCVEPRIVDHRNTKKHNEL